MNGRPRIDLHAPLTGDFQPVVRLIIGGIAERVDFAFEEIDDGLWNVAFGPLVLGRFDERALRSTDANDYTSRNPQRV